MSPISASMRTHTPNNFGRLTLVEKFPFPFHDNAFAHIR